MVTDTIFKSALLSSMERLSAVHSSLQNLHDAQQSIECRCIHLRNLSEDKIGQFLSKIPTGSRNDVDYIYTIEEQNKSGDLVARLSAQLAERQGTHPNERDYPRIIERNKPTSTLYVGRSKKLRQRLSQHLGKYAVGTFALHLQRWAIGIEGNIEVCFLSFSETKNLHVQAIEDALWDSLMPAFGKKGPK